MVIAQQLQFIIQKVSLNGKKISLKLHASLVFISISIFILFAIIFSASVLLRPHEVVSEPKAAEDIKMCFPNDISKDTNLCPLLLNELSGFGEVNSEVNTSYLNEMPEKLGIKLGGRWSPHCTSWQKVAIIIPYRNREKQLKIFLQHMHPFLQSQLVDYGIFVIEQNHELEFNRGQLLNIGFLEASVDHGACCFIFHDVDLLPINPRNLYACSNHPRHVCPAIDVHRYKLLYPNLFGGVVAFSKEQFASVNGFSNHYFGWGAEDDDMYIRLVKKGMPIIRWSDSISKCVMLHHQKETPNPNRLKMLTSAAERMVHDGFNVSKYQVLKRYYKPLYTHIVVKLEI